MSEPERVVAEFLRDELKIWWRYESPIFVYDEKDRPRLWTPDFFLPNLGMFVEVVGSEKNWEDNRQNYQYRKKIFKSNDCHVIFVHFWKQNWKKHTINKIREIENYRHANVEKMLDSVLEKFT